MTGVSVGTLDDIPVGEGLAFAVDGEQVAVFRLGDRTLRALGAVGPHRGGPLADWARRRRGRRVPAAQLHLRPVRRSRINGSDTSVPV